MTPKLQAQASAANPARWAGDPDDPADPAVISYPGRSTGEGSPNDATHANLAMLGDICAGITLDDAETTTLDRVAELLDVDTTSRLCRISDRIWDDGYEIGRSTALEATPTSPALGHALGRVLDACRHARITDHLGDLTDLVAVCSESDATITTLCDLLDAVYAAGVEATVRQSDTASGAR